MMVKFINEHLVVSRITTEKVARRTGTNFFPIPEKFTILMFVVS